MEKPVTLSKTCISCGLQKPMAAFLEVSGPQGTAYGNVCSDCRKTYLEQAKAPKETEDSSQSDTGFKIDAKARIAGEKDKREHKSDVDREYFEEREEDKITQKEESEQTLKKGHEEKKHREFLSHSFLSDKKTTESQRVADSKKAVIAQREIQQNIEHTEKQLQAAQGEQKERDINTDASLDTGIAGKIKYQGEAFKAFARWSGSALGRTFSQPAQSTEKKSDNAADNKETPSEYIEKTWGPNSRGKR